MALAETASRLIAKFGEARQVTLQQPTQAPADPSKPWEVDPNVAFSTKTVNAVVTPIARNLVDGNSVQQGDEQVLIAGLDLGTTVPTTADKILDESASKNVVNVQRIRPGKTDFLWKLQVRP